MIYVLLSNVFNLINLTEIKEIYSILHETQNIYCFYFSVETNNNDNIRGHIIIEVRKFRVASKK